MYQYLIQVDRHIQKLHRGFMLLKSLLELIFLGAIL